MNTNTEISLFFNDVDGDRTYYAEDFAEFFIPFFTNGIFNNGCQVIADKNNMSVDVSAGRGFINGYRYYNKIAKNLIIENADGVLNRIDNIVIRLDLTNRTITAQVVKGTFAEEPQAPDLQRDSVIYDLRIAKISVPAGATSITQDMVTDTRFITSDCGNVISPIVTPDTEKLFIQIQTAFDKELKSSQSIVNDLKTDSDEIIKTTQETIDSDIKKFNSTFNEKINQYDTDLTEKLKDYQLQFSSWFQKVKDTLGTDEAGALLNSINEVEAKIPDITQYYKKIETYNQTEINQLISAVKSWNIIEVSSLPTEEISSSTIYLISQDNAVSSGLAEISNNKILLESKKVITDDKNIQVNTESEKELTISPIELEIKGVSNIASVSLPVDKYYLACIYVQEQWKVIGTTKVNLSEYAKKAEIPTKLSELINDIFVQTSSEEEAFAQSIENPDKFYWYPEEE